MFFVNILIEYSKPRRTLMLPPVLVAIKAKPWRAREVRDLDSHSARRWLRCAGRDGRMGSAGAEQKDAANEKKEQEKEDAMTSDAVA